MSDQTQQTPNEVVRIRPTMVIGLGGTGGDVLLRVRKRFHEKFGRVGELPIVSFLWFDTDTTQKHILAKEVREYVQFEPSEMSWTAMPDTTLVTNNLNEPANRHIRPWWYKGLNDLGQMTEGAGQIRAYSRLSFFHHYTTIRERIRQAHDRIRDAALVKQMNDSPILNELGIAAQVEYTKPTNVYIVCSIAGGTGSGMLIDIAFLLREMFPGSMVNVSAYLVFPDHFGAGVVNDRMKANSYALLKELNHYTYGVPHFEVEWEPGQPRRIPIPPLDYCYLIDSVNSNGQSTGAHAASQAYVFELLAENIFKDFSQGDFADSKRSARINLKQFMNDTHTVEHGTFSQKFIKRYGSFGMASIVVPHHRIMTACAYKLAAEVVSTWAGLLRDQFNPASIPSFINEKMLPQIGLVEEKDGTRHDIMFAMLDPRGTGLSEQGRAAGLQTELRDWQNRVDAEVHRKTYVRQNRTLRDYLHERTDEERVRLRADNAETDKWGHYPRTIRANGDAFLREATERLRLFAYSLIDEKHESIRYVSAVLNDTVEILKGYIEQFRRKLQENEGARSTRGSEASKRLQDVDAATRRSNWDFRKDIIVGYSVSRFLEAVVGTARSPGELQLDVLRYAYNEAIRVCERLIAGIEGTETADRRRLGGLAAELHALGQNLEKMHGDFHKAFLYFCRNEQTPLSLSLYSETDIDDKYYPAYVKGRVQIDETASDCLRVLQRTITGLARDTSPDARQRVEGTLMTCARRRFDRIPIDFHVTKAFFSKFDERQRQQYLEQMLNASGYWVSKSGLFNVYNLPNQQIMKMVAIPDPSGTLSPVEQAELAQNCSKLRADLQRLDGGLAFHTLPESSEIIFYQEAGGFPVNYVKPIKELHEIYARLHNSGVQLHIDCNDKRFQDLLVLDEQGRQALLDANECLLLGCLFDGLEYVDGQYVWYEREGFMRRPRPLGERSRLITSVKDDAGLRKAILDETRARRDSYLAEAGAEGLARFYALLGVYKREAYGEHWGVVNQASDLPQEEMLAVTTIESQQKLVEQMRAAGNGAHHDLDQRARSLSESVSSWATKRPDGRWSLPVPSESGAR